MRQRPSNLTHVPTVKIRSALLEKVRAPGYQGGTGRDERAQVPACAPEEGQHDGEGGRGHERGARRGMLSPLCFSN